LLRPTISKDIRKIVRDAQRRGWVLSACGSGHWKLHKSGVKPIYLSSSSSDRRANLNVLKEMKRVGIIERGQA
jgi:hypothetical protein